MTTTKKADELTEADIIEIESREHQVTITLPGPAYLDLRMMAELREMTVPEYVRDIILVHRLNLLHVVALRARRKADEGPGGMH